MDLSIFLTPEAWISLVTLIFLEIVLGVDNIVFISLTTAKLPPEKQHIGRKLGLAAAMVSRIIFLCFASFLVHLTVTVFSVQTPLYAHDFSVRDLVLGIGGLYLIYKGIAELRETLSLAELKEGADDGKPTRRISLPQAIGTIMVMDVVFSIDSVITAVGLADHLIIMILAVMIAVCMMMVFIDPISNFINGHAQMKILALVFICAIGVLLALDALGLRTGITVIGLSLEKALVYFAMVFSFVLELIQLRYGTNLAKWKESQKPAR